MSGNCSTNCPSNMDNEDSNHPTEINYPKTPINFINGSSTKNGAANRGGHIGVVGIANVKDQECGEHPSQDIVNILDGLDNTEQGPFIEQFNLEEEVSKLAAIANRLGKTSTKFEGRA